VVTARKEIRVNCKIETKSVEICIIKTKRGNTKREFFRTKFVNAKSSNDVLKNSFDTSPFCHNVIHLLNDVNSRLQLRILYIYIHISAELANYYEY